MDTDKQSSASSSSAMEISNTWNWLWNLNLPSKIKVFLWKACKNFFPTRSNLAKRKVITSQSCVICEEGTEDVIHCLYSCPLARQVWAISTIPWFVYNFSGFELRDWCLSMKQKSDTPTFEKCILLCWSLWHNRNKKFFEDSKPEALEIASFALKYLEELRKAEAEVLTVRTVSSRCEVRWRPPNDDTVKINFDAAINRTGGRCGLGAIARSSEGECIGWKSMCIKQPLDPSAAEAKAALVAVELAYEHHWRKVIIEGDSLVIITAIGSESKSYADFGTIIEDIKLSIGLFDSFEAQHIWREGNNAAHEVAKLSSIETYSLNVLPAFIHDIVNADLIQE